MNTPNPKPPKRIRKHVNPLAVQQMVSFSGFKNEAPIIIDVGAGTGTFADGLLKKFPTKNYLLFEIRLPMVERLRQKFKNQQNVVALDGNAGLNFKGIIEPLQNNLESVFINFPDPWPKAKHHKRRFVNEKWLQQTYAWINSRVMFYFQTDFADLFADTLELITESDFDFEIFKNSPHGVQTHWEKAKMEERKEIFRVKFWKP